MKYLFEPKGRKVAIGYPTPKGAKNGRRINAGESFEVGAFEGLGEQIARLNARIQGLDGKPALILLKSAKKAPAKRKAPAKKAPAKKA